MLVQNKMEKSFHPNICFLLISQKVKLLEFATKADELKMKTLVLVKTTEYNMHECVSLVNVYMVNLKLCSNEK